jgi:hypothetical protein
MEISGKPLDPEPINVVRLTGTPKKYHVSRYVRRITDKNFVKNHSFTDLPDLQASQTV